MLFDLRGRGRRRTVKVIYVGLALLFGVGFVGFGVGVGGGGGGLFDAFTNKEGTSGASFEAQIKKDRKVVAKQPQNAAALGKLIQDTLRQAGTGENYNSTEGTFTPKAKDLLREARDEWRRYLALNPNNPSSDLASEMLQVFSGPGGLNEPVAAVATMQIVIAGRPASAALYSSLAQLSYLAKNEREGDLASKKAVSLAPAAQRGLLRSRLEQIKHNPTGQEQSTGAPVAVGKVKSSGKTKKSGKQGTSTGATTTTSTSTSTTTSAPLGF